MSYKLIAVDMDGTLLNNRKQITEKTEKVIKEAVRRGIIFTVSTGRPIQGISMFGAQLDFEMPAITYNGAMIIMSKSREILYHQQMEPTAARAVFACGREYQTTMVVWSNNQLYANVLNDKVHDYKKLSGVEPKLIPDEETLISQGITKMLWYDNVERIRDFEVILKQKLPQTVNYCTSNPAFLEFFDARVSKARAMEKLGEKLHIQREEMIAVGDGNNDLPMLTYAGLGVAMENASDEIKKQCGYVTLSNEEDGVAHVIEKFML